MSENFLANRCLFSLKKILQVEAWSLRGLAHEGLGPNTIQDGGLFTRVFVLHF